MDPDIQKQFGQSENPLSQNVNIVYPNSSKNRNIIILIVIFIILIFLIAGISSYFLASKFKSSEQNKQSNEVANAVKPILTPELTPKYIGDYDVLIKNNSKYACKGNVCTSDVYLIDKLTKEEQYILTADNVNKNSIDTQYQNGYIYLIKKNGLIDELWVYTSNNQGKLIFSNQGMTYLVNPDGTKIAIKEGVTDTNPYLKLDIIDSNGNIINTYDKTNFNEISQYQELMDLFQWENNDILWVSLGGSGSLKYQSISRINTKTGVIETFDLSKLFIGGAEGIILNTTTKQLVYSSYPVFIDEATKYQYLNSKDQTMLYVYDLVTKDLRSIDQGIIFKFKPIWIDNKSIEYNDPKTNSRITKIVN